MNDPFFCSMVEKAGDRPFTVWFMNQRAPLTGHVMIVDEPPGGTRTYRMQAIGGPDSDEFLTLLEFFFDAAAVVYVTTAIFNTPGSTVDEFLEDFYRIMNGEKVPNRYFNGTPAPKSPLTAEEIAELEKDA